MLVPYQKSARLRWSYDLTDHIMVELDTVIALANLTYDAETYMYELHPSDEKVFNDFITKNPWFDNIHIIGPYFCISKLLCTCYIQFLYLLLDPCVRMEMYFEAMRFVSILLDFSKNKMYTGVFLQGACTHMILGFNE